MDTVTLTREELGALLEASAEKGAQKVFTRLGLGDEDAADDIRDMRQWLSAYRLARNTAFKAAVRWVTLGVLAIIAIAVAKYLGINIPPK